MCVCIFVLKKENLYMFVIETLLFTFNEKQYFSEK